MKSSYPQWEKYKIDMLISYIEDRGNSKNTAEIIALKVINMDIKDFYPTKSLVPYRLVWSLIKCGFIPKVNGSFINSTRTVYFNSIEDALKTILNPYLTYWSK